MDDVTSQIIEIETRRCAAMLANDAQALEAILDEDLIFSHATGLIDDKAAYLAKMATGSIDYLSIRWDEQTVLSPAPGAAVLSGRMVSQVRVEGTEKQLINRVLMVWRGAGTDWRLMAFQSTPIKT